MWNFANVSMNYNFNQVANYIPPTGTSTAQTSQVPPDQFDYLAQQCHHEQISKSIDQAPKELSTSSIVSKIKQVRNHASIQTVLIQSLYLITWCQAKQGSPIENGCCEQSRIIISVPIWCTFISDIWGSRSCIKYVDQKWLDFTCGECGHEHCQGQREWPTHF